MHRPQSAGPKQEKGDQPCDALAMSFSRTSNETLEDALTRLKLKRQGRSVPHVERVERRTNFTTLANLQNPPEISNLCNSHSSNDTLKSSVDMLTQEEAAKLSPTNAPIMKKAPEFAKNPMPYNKSF